MAEGRHLDSDYLDRRADRLRERTFLGGMRLSSRAGLLVFFGLACAGAIAAALWYADKQASALVEGWMRAGRVSSVLVRIEDGLADARRRQAEFQRTKDPALIDSHGAAMVALGEDLETLETVVRDADVRRAVATVREGADQYATLFEEAATAERELGLADDEGLRGQMNQATDGLRAALNAAGIDDLDAQVTQLGQRVRLVEVPLSDQDRGALELEYDAISARVAEAVGDDDGRQAIQRLVDAHRTAAFAYINARTVLSADPRRFQQVFEYIDPSLSKVRAFAQATSEQSPMAFELRRERLRLEVGGAVAAALALYILIALVLLRSVSVPVRRMAMAAARLAQGDKVVAVPAQGNADSLGDLARSLDTWMDDLVEADHLRLELEDAKARLEAARDVEKKAIQRADAAEATARDTADKLARMAATEPPVPVTEAPRESPAPTEAATPEPAVTDAPAAGDAYDEAEVAEIYEDEDDGSVAGVPDELADGVAVPSLTYAIEGPRARSGEPGPIFTVSQQLSQFTEYISAAARDVERTEVLIRTLGETSHLVDELTDTIAGFRDQTHALVFAASDVSTEQAEALAPRFKAVRDVTDRAERIVDAVRTAVDEVVAVSHEIAETASAQALDATRKLLAQSEHLQAMLDDVVAKLHPAAPPPSDDQDG